MPEQNCPAIVIFASLVFIMGKSYSYHYICSTLQRKPCFDTSYPTNFSSQIGDTAIMNCVIYHVDFSKISISWWKEGDLTELTLGEMVINSRYKIYRKLYNHWSLVIENVTSLDSGVYICQINLKKVLENVFHLYIEPKTITQNDDFPRPKHYIAMPGSLPLTSVVLRGPSVVEVDEPFHLICLISPIPKTRYGDVSIEWRQNKKLIQTSNSWNNNVHITMQWKPNSTLISYIYVQRATIRHQGIWSCNIVFPDSLPFWELEISKTSTKSIKIKITDKQTDVSRKKLIKFSYAQMNRVASVILVILCTIPYIINDFNFSNT